MGATTIQWADFTFNPWIGCQKVSPGCTSCYASVDTFARRSRSHGVELWGGKSSQRHVTSDAYWRQPFSWQRAAVKVGERRRVFCSSLADVFEDREDLRGPRSRLRALVWGTPNLDWLLLTKRPENAARLWTAAAADAEGNEAPDPSYAWEPNVWLGTSVEDQARADERIPHLLAVPAAVRFLSVEPLLGPVDFRIPFARFAAPGHTIHGVDGLNVNALRGVGGGSPIPAFDWVIVGGESGPGARPCDVAWIRGVVEQCRAASVPCFVKQLGSLPAYGGHDTDESGHRYVSDRKGGDPAEWPEDLRVREFPRRSA